MTTTPVFDDIRTKKIDYRLKFHYEPTIVLMDEEDHNILRTEFRKLSIDADIWMIEKVLDLKVFIFERTSRCPLQKGTTVI